MPAHLLDNRQLGRRIHAFSAADNARLAGGFMPAHLPDNRQLGRRIHACSAA